MLVGGKYIKTCIVILYFLEIKSSIGNYIINFLGNKIKPINQDMSHKSINNNTKDELLFTLKHGIDLQ